MVQLSRWTLTAKLGGGGWGGVGGGGRKEWVVGWVVQKPIIMVEKL